MPALFIVTVIGKVLHDELVDSVEGQTLFRATPDGHHDQGVVRKWRFLILLTLLIATCFTVVAFTVVVVVASLRLFVTAFLLARLLGFTQVDRAGRLGGTVEILNTGLFFTLV